MNYLKMKNQLAVAALAIICFTACKKNDILAADPAIAIADSLIANDSASAARIVGISALKTYYVSTSGNDATGTGAITNPWKSLYKATSTVSTPGAVIHVNAGTYTETRSCELGIGITLIGEGAASTIIKSAVTGSYSTFLTLSSPQDNMGYQSISNISFDGQFVNETDYKTWMAIVVKGRSNVSIHDTRIVNFKDRGVVFDGNDDPNPLSDPGHYATGNQFYNNTVLNSATQDAVFGRGLLNIGGQMGMLIHDNTLIQDQRGTHLNGWPIKYADNGWLKGVKIYNNIITKKAFDGLRGGDGGSWNFAIELFNIEGLEISNNTIQGSIDLNYNRKGAYAHCAWIHNNVLNHATLNPNYESGIVLEFRTESILIENNVINNATTGVQFNTRGVNNTGGFATESPAPVGGYSVLSNNIIRNNLFSNIYQGTGIGVNGGVSVISDGSDDEQINGLDIYNNTIIAKPGLAPLFGIDLSSLNASTANGTNINIRNNIVNGFSHSWLRGTNGNTRLSNVTVTHNDTYGNANNNLPSWPAGNPVNYTYNNNLSVNPLFVSATSFLLQGSSPCINKGINIGLLFNGAAPDMGYAEY